MLWLGINPPLGLVTTLLIVTAIATIVSATVGVIQSFRSPKPAKVSFGFQGDIGGSPRYGQIGPLDNTVSNELAIPVVYGQMKLAGNVIWQTDPGETVKRLVAVCEGEVNSITDVRANDVTIEEITGSSYSTYVGTGAQKADSRLPDNLRPDMELHHLTYIAMTLQAGDKLKGGNPTITSLIQGLKVGIYTGGVWDDTNKAYSRNPAACVRDFLINSRYGLGIPVANVDTDSFGSVYDHCETQIASPPSSIDGFVVLMLHMDATDGSTDFLDSSFTPKTATAAGAAQIDTAQFRAGGASGLFNGSNSYVELADHDDFDFGTGDFTVEFDVRFNSVPVASIVTFVSHQTAGFSEFTIEYSGSLSAITVTIGNTGTSPSGFAWTPSTGVWYRVEVNRSGTQVHVFVDGNRRGSVGSNSSSASNTGVVRIGASGQPAPTQFFDGWIDELRISKGVARHTDDYEISGPDESRFRLDYVCDSQRPAQDVLNDMLATFGGFLVYAGSKVKLKVEKEETITQYFGDGSTTHLNASFDPGNIVKDSFSWNMSSIDDRANRIRIQWIDPGQDYVKVYTQVEDRIDQDERNTIITKDVSLLGITRQSQALRMAKLQMAIAKYANINYSFAARLESVHCEPGDVIAVTHQAGRFTRRLMRIVSMQEAEDETIQFTCRDYIASLYDDRHATAITSYNQAAGPSPLTPLTDVTNLVLTEDNFKNKDGVFVTNILAEWTAIGDTLRLSQHLIQLSSDGGATYRDVGWASAEKTDFRIVLGNVQTGTTFVVRVRTVSDVGSVSTGTTASVTITGKVTPPSNVEDFDVSFAVDHLSFTWSAINDEDLFGYEIRVGNSNSTWESATIITTETLATRYDLFNFTRGTKKFFIKAIDNSQNYSEVAASDQITITEIPDSNVVVTFDMWSRITDQPHPLQGILSSDLDRIPTRDFDPAYYRLTLAPKTASTWQDLQDAGDTWLALQNSSFRFGRETYVTTEESFEYGYHAECDLETSFNEDCALMLHFDGTDGSTTFTDSSLAPKQMTAQGNAQIDTAQAKFGSASGLFDGTGDYLTTPNHADFNFGTGDFTVECRVRFTGTYGTLYDKGVGADGFSLEIHPTNPVRLDINGVSFQFGTTQDYNWPSHTNEWQHVLVSRSGTSLRCFIEGNQIGSTLTSSDNISSAETVAVGARNTGSGPFAGHIDELRVIKGDAVWTANFNPPTAAYSSCDSTRAKVIDLGQVYTATFILDMMAFSNTNLGFITPQISTSDDNETYSDYTPFVPGQYTGRYIRFKFLLQATTPTAIVRLIGAVLTIDVPDRRQFFLNESVSAGGRTFYPDNFQSVKSIIITTVGTSNLTPRIHDQSNLPTAFDVRLFDINGALTAGNVNITVFGY